MEPLFINDFTPGKEDMKEFVNVSFRKVVLVMSLIISAWFFIMAGLFCASLIQYGAKYIAPMVLCLVIAVFFLIFFPLRKHRTLKLALRQEKLMGNGDFRQRTVTFYDDHLDTLSGASFRYEQISKVRVTASCIVLIMEKSVGILLRKDAFTHGDLSSFIQFLRSKGVSVPGVILD